MRIEICDICQTNPKEKICLLPVKLWRFEYYQKWWNVKRKKKVICTNCLEKIFNSNINNLS